MPTDTTDYSPDHSLTAPQHHVLNLIAEGHSLTEAAAATGVHRNTIRNWRRTVPAFARELEFAAREQAAVWHEQAIQRASRASKVIDEILDDPKTSPSVRLRAALAILKIAADPNPPSSRFKPNRLAPFEAQVQAIVGKLISLRTGGGDHLADAPEADALEAGSPEPAVVHPPQIYAQSRTTNVPIRRAPEPGRNSQCPCGSGLKYKRCCASASGAQRISQQRAQHAQSCTTLLQNAASPEPVQQQPGPLLQGGVHAA